MGNLKDKLILNSNLNTLREREARYAGNAPLDLLNQIDDQWNTLPRSPSKTSSDWPVTQREGSPQG